MFKLTINNKEYLYEKKVTLEEISKSLNIDCYGAKVNNRLRELTYYIDYDANIEFVDLNDNEGARIYQNTLRYIITMAIYNLYPGYNVRISQHVSRSFLCAIKGIKENEEFINKLDNEIKRIISADYKINRAKLSKEEAIRIYTKQQMLDKIETFKFRPENTVNANECNGFYNYMYGYMLPSTSYISKYRLIEYFPGFILQYPRSDTNGDIPEFEDAPVFSKMIRDAYQWSQNCKQVSSLVSMNEFSDDKNYVDLVNMCETKHNNMLADLGLKIKANIDEIKIIAIAGPSSSGKTTFCNRLRVELMSRGIFPLMISIDDYYTSKDKTPIDEYGNPDYEHIEALDIEYFNKQINDLLSGKEVNLPIYDFKTGERHEGRKVKLLKGQPILIEGIHALNERLTHSISRENKFKIYISPFHQVNIDNHNPIFATDIRMLRRVVRDNNFRKTSPEKTFAMWQSVRRGEFKWIYPFQEEADYVYNTELTYEIMVMKKYALPALKTIESDSPYYIEANRLIKFLKLVRDIDDKYVPCNSILREFIGGSCFYDE